MPGPDRGTKVAIYARVSLAVQDPELQLDELRTFCARRGWTIAAEHVDHGVSGTKESRPALDRLLADARRRRFDAVVVWRFDRFARSVKHLVLALEEFNSLGVAFVSVREALDFGTPMGRAMFAVIAAMCEMERDILVERVRAGLSRAKATGKSLGRPRATLDLDAARARLGAGESLRAVCRALEVDRRTLARALKR